MKLFYEIPAKVVSRGNTRGHTRAKAREIKAEKLFISMFMGVDLERAALTDSGEPWQIHMVRVAPRALDDDNLAIAFKAFRDQIAKHLGRDDRPGTGLLWTYDQRRGKPKQYALEVTLQLGPPVCEGCGQLMPLTGGQNGTDMAR